MNVECRMSNVVNVECRMSNVVNVECRMLCQLHTPKKEKDYKYVWILSSYERNNGLQTAWMRVAYVKPCYNFI